jgi:hypothetical protein
MKTPHFNLRLIFSGDTMLVVFSFVLLLAVLGCPMPQVFRVLGGLTILLGPAFFILSCLELIKYQRQKRTIVAAITFLAATVIYLIKLIALVNAS